MQNERRDPWTARTGWGCGPLSSGVQGVKRPRRRSSFKMSPGPARRAGRVIRDTQHNSFCYTNPHTCSSMLCHRTLSGFKRVRQFSLRSFGHRHAFYWLMLTTAASTVFCCGNKRTQNLFATDFFAPYQWLISLCSAASRGFHSHWLQLGRHCTVIRLILRIDIGKGRLLWLFSKDWALVWLHLAAGSISNASLMVVNGRSHASWSSKTTEGDDSYCRWCIPELLED